MHIPTASSTRVPSMRQPNSDYEVVNPPHDFEAPEDVTEHFSITAIPNSRLGRKNPLVDEFTAPMVLRRMRTPFVLSEVTVSGDFYNDWDQAGLVIFVGGSPAHPQTYPSIRYSPYSRRITLGQQQGHVSSKWARVALEVTSGELAVSTLVANPKCGVDWASTPAFPLSRADEIVDPASLSIRLKLERVGSDLWVWFMNPDAYPSSTAQPTPEYVRRQWRKCREIINFFDDPAIKGDTWVGCYASRPVESEHEGDDEGLIVDFEELEIL